MKWCDKIGYATTAETAPGIWEETIVEKLHMGDVLRSSRRITNTDRITDDVNISNQLSILADPYATENIYAMRYAVFMGAKWRITDVEVAYPRLTLTLGGVYSGN